MEAINFNDHTLEENLTENTIHEIETATIVNANELIIEMNESLLKTIIILLYQTYHHT